MLKVETGQKQGPLCQTKQAVNAKEEFLKEIKNLHTNNKKTK